MSEHRLVPVEILDRFPEINTSNYSHDDACALNAWGVELVLAAAPAPEPRVEQEPVAFISISREGAILDWKPQYDVLRVDPLYSRPPAAPDVSGLVEALEGLVGCIMETRGPCAARALESARAALSAHREQQS